MAAPDGYTLVLGTTGSLGIGPAFFANAGYDPVKSFAPVAMVASVPFVLVAGRAAPVATAQEAIAYAKANPGKLSFGAATGSPPQFACEKFKHDAGIDLHRVPSRGPQAITDLLAGEVHLVCEAATLLLPLIREGNAKPLAVMNTMRLPQLPDVPTTAELNLPDVLMTVWAGVLAPAGTPGEIVQKLNAAINDALNSSDLRVSLDKIGVDPRPGSPAEFGAFIAAEAKTWGALVKLTGETSK
jgi:tripartite-type tricarboxylate transporter receptor subunit TctC